MGSNFVAKKNIQWKVFVFLSLIVLVTVHLRRVSGLDLAT